MTFAPLLSTIPLRRPRHGNKSRVVDRISELSTVTVASGNHLWQMLARAGANFLSQRAQPAIDPAMLDPFVALLTDPVEAIPRPEPARVAVPRRSARTAPVRVPHRLSSCVQILDLLRAQAGDRLSPSLFALVEQILERIEQLVPVDHRMAYVLSEIRFGTTPGRYMSELTTLIAEHRSDADWKTRRRNLDAALRSIVMSGLTPQSTP